MQSLIPCPASSRTRVFTLLRRAFPSLLLTALAMAQTAQAATPEEELLRQRERERVLRDQLETRPDIRLEALPQEEAVRLPREETPCFRIDRIELIGEAV
ncbi:hypothetical protein ACNFCK_03645 [Pseudomonas sp. NY15366]|jgi:hemolysin activation/secretion protein